jgi:predicted nucleotidyltransferase
LLALSRQCGYRGGVRRTRLEGPELQHYLGLLTGALVDAFSPERVILFGSFARGDQNRASDVDLVVVASTPLAFHERIGRALASCYSASTRLPVEALVYTPEEWARMVAKQSSFATLVLREGLVLYDKEQEPDRVGAVAQAGAARS